MTKRYSIAQARDNLAALVHELERRSTIELTRRGQPVAVLLSMREYRRLAAPKEGFWKAYEAFRASIDLERLNITPEVLGGVRDRSTGREVRL
jgi:prevent-host-death family protein